MAADGSTPTPPLSMAGISMSLKPTASPSLRGSSGGPHKTAAPPGSAISDPKRRRVADVFAAAEAEEAAAAYADVPGLAQTLAGLSSEAQADLLQRQGCDFAEAGKFHRAIDMWDSALELLPHKPQLYELKAQALMALDQDFAAIQCALRATQLDPAWPDGWLTLGRAQLNFGELQLAHEALSRVLKLRPEDTAAAEDLAFVKVQLTKQAALLAAKASECGNTQEDGSLCILTPLLRATVTRVGQHSDADHK